MHSNKFKLIVPPNRHFQTWESWAEVYCYEYDCEVFMHSKLKRFVAVKQVTAFVTAISDSMTWLFKLGEKSDWFITTWPSQQTYFVIEKDVIRLLEAYRVAFKPKDIYHNYFY